MAHMILLCLLSSISQKTLSFNTMKSVEHSGIYGTPLSVFYFGASGEPQSLFVTSLIQGYTYNSSTGAISIAAGGTNQSITLTPSGSGVLTTPNSIYVGRTTGTRRVEVGGVAFGANQSNGYRIATIATLGTSGYVAADFLLKSDGAGSFRGAVEILPNGTGSTTEVFSWTTGGLTVQAGDLAVNTAGRGLKIKSGSNAKKGTATLINGVVTVSNTSVASGSQVIITRGAVNASTAIGFATVSKSAGVSFTVTSRKSDMTTETGDQSSLEWMMVDEA